MQIEDFRDMSIEHLDEGSMSSEQREMEELANEDRVVSFQAELPIALQKAMTSYIERYPNWDQYRLIQAALAGFLVQNGVDSRPITRLYVGNMFGREGLLQEI